MKMYNYKLSLSTTMTIKMVMPSYGNNIEMYEETKDLVRNKINQNTSVVPIKKLT